MDILNNAEEAIQELAPFSSEALRADVAREASCHDYSKTDAKTLVSDFVWASTELEKMAEQTKEVAAMLEILKLQEDPGFERLVLSVYPLSRSLTVYLQGIINAALREIFNRGSGNKVSWYFGLLRLNRGDCEIQRKALGYIYRVAIAIARSHGWWHPEDKEGWKSVARQTLANEFSKHQELGLADILERIVERKFGYLRKAMENDFKDELRSLKRRPHEGVLSEEERESVFQNAPTAAKTPEEDYLSRSTADALKKAGKGCEPLFAIVADVLADMLPKIAGQTDAKVRADFNRELAKRKGVSVQQARKDLERVRSTKSFEIQEFKALLKAGAEAMVIPAACASASRLEMEEG